MADTDNKPLMHGFEDNSATAAETARKLEAQNIEGLRSTDEFGDTSSALDALRAEKQKAIEATPATEEVVEAKPAAEVKPEVKPDAEAKPVAEETKTDIFSDVQLPPNARPNSAQAFATVKERANAEIGAREKTISELKTRLAETESKLKETPAVPPELEQELTSLREWRAKLDVDADPKFREFDAHIANTEAFIYAQLKRSPKVTDAMIEQIKGLGGPANVNLGKLFEHVGDPTLQRIVEAKVADIEVQKFNKENAIKSTKANVAQYLKEREEQFKASAAGHNTATRAELDKIISKSSWFQKKEVPANATSEDRTRIENENKAIEQIRAEVEMGLQDDSPQMRAVMLMGMAKCFWLQGANEAKAAQITALTNQVTELSAKLEKIKASSTTRLRETAAKDDGIPKPAKTDDDGYGFGQKTSQAVDDLARKIAEEKRAAANV